MKAPSTDPESSRRFIACGMYAFTDDLRTAWQTLFDHFFQCFESPYPYEPVLQFDTGASLMRDSHLLIGQTCGYPLVSKLIDAVTPMCVPIFDVAGCEGKRYSSMLMVAENSEIESLADCYRGIAAINNSDSNSGMNVLRHAVAPLSQAKSYFSSVRETGSHLHSLTEVAEGKAHIAAIDVVSFSYIQDAWPDLAARVRSIGYTAKTCGLPFVVPHSISRQFDKNHFTACLNEATAKMPHHFRQSLRLQKFERADMDEYQSVLDLEKHSRQAGYLHLS